MNKPIAVLIADVHYNLKNLELADNAMRQAITKANDLQVPLIVAGDLHDTKANMRGECVNTMIETLNAADEDVYILIGNHDKINEKSVNHSLNFLKNEYPTRFVIDNFRLTMGLHLIPYQHDLTILRAYLKTVPKGSTVIMHQGVTGSNSGEYIQDKTAITKNDVAGLRVISGHYHQRQDIVLPDGGLWSYIGNPYTQNFAEASDPEKGFQILMDDGSLEFVPTNLRKHVVYEIDANTRNIMSGPFLKEVVPPNLVWVKVKGKKEDLIKYTKDYLIKVFGFYNFKLDLIPTDTALEASKKQNLSKPELLDSIIDSLAIDNDRKSTIKEAWRAKA